MKTLKTSLLTFIIAFISMAAFSQAKNIKITKPISSEDLTKVKAILDTFDPNSYSAAILTTDKKKYVTTGKGLESVSQITGTSPSSSKFDMITISATVNSRGLRPAPVSVGACTFCAKIISSSLQQLDAILSKYN